MSLSDLRIRSLKPRPKLYRVADRDGLALEVSPSGTKHWRYRFRWAGRATMISLGPYPAIGLAHALPFERAQCVFRAFMKALVI
nr:Arm DNA-binding domain-containing protein [Thermomonas paludicola]